MSEFRGAPIDVFNREFCVVCSNRECSRSWGNASVFDRRVKNWHEILFKNVQRITDNTNLANQGFQPLEPKTMTPEINSYFVTTEPEKINTQEIRINETQETTKTNTQEVPTPIKTTPTPTPAPIKTTPVQFQNTMFNQPLMVGESKKENSGEKIAESNCVFVFDDE